MSRSFHRNGVHSLPDGESRYQCDEQRNAAEYEYQRHGALLNGLSLGCALKETGTFADIILKAACPVVVLEVVQKYFLEHLAPGFAEGVLRVFAVAENRPVAVIHAEKQHDTLAVGSLAHVVLMVYGVGRLEGRTHIEVTVIVHRHDIDADSVLLRDSLRHFFKLLPLGLAEKSGIVRDIVKLRSARRGGAVFNIACAILYVVLKAACPVVLSEPTQEGILNPLQGGVRENLGYAVFKLPQLTEKTISLELPFVKTVKQGGGVAPGEESFRLEIIRNGESVPAQYMKVSYSAAVTTNGVGDFSSKLVITGPESQVEGFIDGGFYIREVKGYNDRWTYSDALWYAHPYMDSGDSGDQLKLQIYSASIMSSDNGSYYVWNRENPVDKMSFENVYTFDDPVIKVEIPFTKTVKQGGTNAPNKQTFKLEIFDVGNGNADNYKDVSYTASVSTNGKGDYNGTMVITGPRSQVREFICEGFLVREVKGSASFWSYSDAVWAVIPEYDVENDVTKLYIYPTKAEKTEDGNRYVWENMSAAGRMSFTNTYTYSPAAAPKTGDDSNMLLLCALLVTSGTAAVLWLEVIRRRRSDS